MRTGGSERSVTERAVLSRYQTRTSITWGDRPHERAVSWQSSEIER